MKGFKNTTRTQYFTGGDVGGYAKGGTAKAAKPAMAKAAKPAMAKAKAPMKKSDGGNKMTASEMRAMEARFGEKKATEGRRFGVFNEGGKVRKYAEGGPAKPFDASAAYQGLGANLKDMIDSGRLTIEQANALKAPAFEATRLRDPAQQQQAMKAALDAAYGKTMPSGVATGVGDAGVGSPRKPFDASAAYQGLGADLKSMIDSGQLTIEQANALRAPAFEATRLRDPAQQQQAMQAALAAARGQFPPPIDIVQPGRPTPPPVEEQVAPDGPLRPTREQIEEFYAHGKGGIWDPDRGVFLTTEERRSMLPPRGPPRPNDYFPGGRPQVMPPVDIEMTRLPQVMPPPPPPPPLPPPTPLPEPYYPGNDVFRPTLPMKPPLTMEQPTPPPMQKIYEPPRPTPPMPRTQPEPYYPGNDVFRPTPPTVYDNFPPGIIDKPRDPMQPQNPPGMGGTSSAIRDLLTKQPPTKGPMSPRGMGLLEQRQPRMPEKNVTMMKHGGRTAMPKGKR
jgi:hypothetical protein